LAPLLARAAQLEQQDRERALAVGARQSVAGPASSAAHAALPEGLDAIRAPMAGKLVELSVAVGDTVLAGQTVAVLEAMKMEHTVPAGAAGRVVALRARAGEQVADAQPLVVVEPAEPDRVGVALEQAGDPRAIRTDLRRVIERHALTLDEARPEAVA